MSTFLRTIEFLSLSLWLGSDVFLSFVVAPGAFRILGSRDQAGAMVGFVVADAFHRSRVRDRDSAGALAEDPHIREFRDAGSALRSADDSSHRCVAPCS